MKRTLFVYAMTCDSNFAPCIQEGLLTLACCKGGKNGGMRKSAGELYRNRKDPSDEIWILGVCGKGLKKSAVLNEEEDYNPVFMARITNVLTMKAYYTDAMYSGRADHGAYTVCNDTLMPIKKESLNPHRDETDPEHEAIMRDVNGKYVLISDTFVYFGKSNRENAKMLRSLLPGYFFDSAADSGTKAGIDKHYRGYIRYNDFDTVDTGWLDFLQNHMRDPMPGNDHLSEEFIPDDDDDESDCVHISCKN